MTTALGTFLALLLGGTAPAAAAAPGPQQKPPTPQDLIGQACVAPGVFLQVVPSTLPAPGMEASRAVFGEAASSEAEVLDRDLGQTLGEGLSPAKDAAETEAPTSFTWMRGDQPPDQCALKVSELARRWPGRVVVAPYYPGMDLAEVRKGMEGSIPSGLTLGPSLGALSWSFDRASGDLTAGGVPGVAGRFRSSDWRPPSGRTPYDGRWQGPSSFRRSFGATPSPRGGSGSPGWTERAGDWVADRWRRGVGWAGDRVNEVAHSLGMPWAGHLKDGVPLPREGPGFRFVRYGQWGTTRLVEGLEWMGAQVNSAGGPALQIGDMSFKYGGPIRRHKSHQNGRDVDVFFVGGAKGGGFDVAANWKVAELALTNPKFQVTNIFVDASLKARLLDYARSHGADKSVIQKAAAVMSHEPGHGDHFHIRIA